MRARTFALVTLVAAVALSVQAADPPVVYRQFASSAGRYKVLFPGAVKSETTDVKTPAGDRKLTLDTVEVSEAVVFLVTYIDTPDDVAKAPAGPRLEKVRDATKGTDGKVLADKEVAVGADKHPGRDVLIEKPAAVLRVRIVIAGNRLYQVMIQGPKEFVTAKDADRFFDSFEVTR